MGEAKYDLTVEILKRLPAYIVPLGDVTFAVNPEEGSEFDESVDDEIVITLDGVKLPFGIHSGPYGCGVDTEIFDANGDFEGVLHGTLCSYATIDVMLNELTEKIEAVAANATPAP